MKHLYNSNILEVTSGIIMQGCNAQGVMGSGVARQLRAKYPEIYGAYARHVAHFLELNKSPLGTVNYVLVHNNLVIANAITQEYYGRDGTQYVSYQAIHRALKDVVSIARVENRTIHVPYLIGAGLGGGDETTIMDIFDLVGYEHICFHHLNNQ